eukprot:15073011-Heterocapsa_arctica.AAC.1
MEVGAYGSSPGADLPCDGHTMADSQVDSQGGFTYAESQDRNAGDCEGQPCTSVCVHTHPLMLL